MPRGILLGMLLVAACGEVLESIPTDAAAQVDAAVDAAATVDAVATLRITNVLVPPAGVEVEGGTDSVVASLVGPPGTQLTVMFGGNLGAYAPATSTLTLGVNGAAMATSTFTANATGGTAMGTTIITMPAGVTPYDFSFPVVPFTKYGNTTAFTTGGSFAGGVLLGQTIVTTGSGRLRKFGLISEDPAGAAVKIGLYTDAAGQPASLVAQIPGTSIVAGVNELALPSPVVLPAGTYWLMAIYSSYCKMFRASTPTRMIKYITQPAANALPATFPDTHMTYTGPDINYYLVVGR